MTSPLPVLSNKKQKQISICSYRIPHANHVQKLLKEQKQTPKKTNFIL